jgi:YVTN family beta-propeller protein
MLTRFVAAAVLVGAVGACMGQGAPDAVSAECEAGVVREVWLLPRALPEPGRYGARLAVNYIDVNSPPEGDIPRELAFTPDGQTVVIANQGTGVTPGTLTFFNMNTRTITNTVTVGLFPNFVAVSPNGQYAVCTNVFSHTVSVVDIATHTLLGNVPVTGTQPFRVAITPDSHFALVGVTNTGTNSVYSVIDLNTRTEARTFPNSGMGAIGSYATPEVGITSGIWSQFALTPDGTTIVHPDRAAARVILYDFVSGAQITSLATAVAPTSVDISADGTTAIVGNEFNARRISKIDIAARTLTQLTIADDIQNQIIRITPDKNYAIAAISNNVVFYSLASGATAATLFTGVVGDIEISFDGQYAFVSNANSSVINIATRTIAAVLPLAPCAEAACSPTQLRAAALNDRFREDIQVYSINGVASAVEGMALTGEPPEGDCTRSVGLSANGQVLVAGNTTSRNVAVINAPTRTVLGYVNTGDRILDLAVTPNGQYAVVCNTDDGSGTVSVVDTGTRTRVAHLSCPTRPAKVKISPDGTKAYVLAVAGTDMIYFINLAGAGSSVLGTVIAGQTGTAQGYAYTETSGIELSPDGSILAVCVSFDDNVKLIDTATRAVIATVPVGIDAVNMEFPMRCAFSPDGTRLYVSMAFGDALAVVNVNGAASARIATVPVGDFPLTVNVDPANQFVYVGTSGSNPLPGIYVVNTATNTMVRSLLLGGTVRAAALDNGVLYAAGLNTATGGKLWRVSAAGVSSALMDETTLSGSPSDMAYSAVTKTVYLAQPVPDGVDAVYVGPPCGTADFNCDGDVGTDTDIESFFACLAGTCPAAPCTSTADFNGDGDVGTDADIEAFFRVLAGGAC